MSEIIDGISHINKDELQALLQNPDDQTVIIDVREPFEYEAAHIPGVPLIPMGEIPYRLEEFDPAKDYVLICRSGSRSFEVARFLRHNGLERVHNYSGGMLNWDGEVESGLPAE